MDVLIDRVAGIDLGKKMMVVAVRTPDGKGGRRTSTRTFGTTTGQVLELLDWLLAERVSVAAMEATGSYWKPVYYLLEDHVDTWLCNARHIKAVPGRKTDVRDSQWIAQLVECGLVTKSFVPPAPIRELRDLTRFRKTVIQERTREVQRLEKVLEDAGIKLSSVSSATLNVSTRRMIEALIAGQRDPAVLADMALKRMRTKIPALQEALVGRFGAHHALLATEMLHRIDEADATITRLSLDIEQRMDPFRESVQLLITIPGVDIRTAQTIIAEIGTDMSVFGSPEKLASWAGMCPGNNESANKRKSTPTRKGSKWLRAALVQSASAAARSKNTYLSAQYWRIAGRRGRPRAAVAVGHSILVIAYHLLSRRQPYRDLGGDYFTNQLTDEARTRRLLRQLEALGHTVTIEPAA